MSLLEVMTAATITATLMASSMIVLRGSYAAWQAHEADMTQADTAYAVLRHIVRHIRQAEAVTAITPSTNNAGGLTLLMPSGDRYVWQHNAGTKQVLFGIDTATALLADNIESLTFHAYEADGVTITTLPSATQTLKCVVTVLMPAGGGTTRTVSCTGWVRSW